MKQEQRGEFEIRGTENPQTKRGEARQGGVGEGDLQDEMMGKGKRTGVNREKKREKMIKRR